jgi:hypothetical protein
MLIRAYRIAMSDRNCGPAHPFTKWLEKILQQEKIFVADLSRKNAGFFAGKEGKEFLRSRKPSRDHGLDEGKENKPNRRIVG